MLSAEIQFYLCEMVTYLAGTDQGRS